MIGMRARIEALLDGLEESELDLADDDGGEDQRGRSIATRRISPVKDDSRELVSRRECRPQLARRHCAVTRLLRNIPAETPPWPQTIGP